VLEKTLSTAVAAHLGRTDFCTVWLVIGHDCVMQTFGASTHSYV